MKSELNEIISKWEKEIAILNSTKCNNKTFLDGYTLGTIEAISLFIKDLKILNEATVEQSKEVCDCEKPFDYTTITGAKYCLACNKYIKQTSTKRI